MDDEFDTEEQIEEQEPTAPNAPKCIGKKQDGNPCGMYSTRGSVFCRHHGGFSSAMKHNAAKHTGPLLPYPFHDGGVNENAAIRMIRMVIPGCPVDGVAETRSKDGTYHPNPNFTGEQNCQQVYKKNNQGVWDVDKCKELGHDPYYTKFRVPIMEEVLDPNGYVTETRIKYRVERRLNIIQVSDNPRHSNRMEVQLALAKGCRFLEDFGIESPCEFRNCSAKTTVDTRYGKYCSERHARLIAADFQKVILPVGGDPYTQDQALEERESMLAALNIRKA